MPVSSVSCASSLPDRADAVVVGGGVMGCSTLYHLAKRGVDDAVLLERNSLTSGTTWHSAALVRTLRSLRNLTEMIRYSVELYSLLEDETGQSAGWINNGALSVASTDGRLDLIRRQQATSHLRGIRAEFLSAGEIREMWPLVNAHDLLGGVWSPDDGRVSPSDLCAALVKGAKARGAKIFENSPCLEILVEGGRAVGVRTPTGELRSERIAVCCGLWSEQIGRDADVNVALYPCEHFYLLTQPIDEIQGNLPTLIDQDGRLYLRDEGGGLLAGAFEPRGKPIDPSRLGEDFAFQLLPEDWDHFEPMLRNALHRVPRLETAEIKTLLNGPESFTPDGLFMLGETPEARGLFLGCGMNSAGVASAGGAGMALAASMIDGRPPKDLLPLDPSRTHHCFAAREALAERIPEILGEHYDVPFPDRQRRTARNLRHLPLHERWIAEKAWFEQVFGWERPLYFAADTPPKMTFGPPSWRKQVGEEVRRASDSAALFELSAFGKIDVGGPDAEKFLSRMLCNRMNRPPGRAIYTAMINRGGGMESDLTAIRLAEDRYRLFVGSTSVLRDLTRLKRGLEDFNEPLDVVLSDVTESYAHLGLMGPASPRIAEALGADALNELGFFRAAETDIGGIPILAARVSYVGEAGWEIGCRAEDAENLYDRIRRLGVKPAGFHAMDSMRMEKRFVSYGHDVDSDLTPLDAGLDFAIDWDSDFIGKSALVERRENSNPFNRIVTLVFDDDDAAPHGHEPIYLNHRIVGETTSGGFGFRIGAPLAIADVHIRDAVKDRKRVEVDLGGIRRPATLRIGPTFDPEGKRVRP